VYEPTTLNTAWRTVIAVDVAKSVFQTAVSRTPGRVDQHHRLPRARLLEYFAQQPPATVVMDACGSAHHWARQVQTFGHRVALLPAQHVRKYRIGNKTDRSAMLDAFHRAATRRVFSASRRANTRVVSTAISGRSRNVATSTCACC
jgi:transposase